MAQDVNGSPTRAVRASRKWQKKQRRKGLCPKCGAKAEGFYCRKHQLMDAARKKARRHALEVERNGSKKKSARDERKSLNPVPAEA